MKINLTTTPIHRQQDDALTDEQLLQAPDGVYICKKHVHDFPSQRLLKQGDDITYFEADRGKVYIHPVKSFQKDTECRFILAPEQIVNITFEKERTVREEIADLCASSPATPAFVPHGILVPGATGQVIEGFRVPANSDQYRAFQLASGLKPGDKVRITRTAKTHEGGWANSWPKEMNDLVGGVFTVEATPGDCRGIRLSGVSYNWPFFVLEKVA